MKLIYGKKLGMTRVFKENGDMVGVSVIEVEPATVMRVKTTGTDGYDAVVIGFGSIRQKLVNKPLKGQFEKAGIEQKRYLREIRSDKADLPAKGEVLTVEVFKVGETVHVTSISRGLGFQGAVKRHHFRGGPKSHGQSDRMRAPGSVGASSYPSRTFKGQRMAGHMGNAQVTVKNLKIVDVKPELNLLLVSGVIPGHKNSLVTVRKAR